MDAGDMNLNITPNWLSDIHTKFLCPTQQRAPDIVSGATKILHWGSNKEFHLSHSKSPSLHTGASKTD